MCMIPPKMRVAYESKLVGLFEKARALVAKGWTKCAFKRSWSNGSADYCTVGAINAVTPFFSSERWRMRGMMRDVVGENIIDWNDTPTRRKADVLAAFDNAITRARRLRPRPPKPPLPPWWDRASHMLWTIWQVVRPHASIIHG